MDFKGKEHWAVILGGSSGFGLASAKKLASLGMNICIVHRDRKGAMARIDEQFAQIIDSGVKFVSYNADALAADVRKDIIANLKEKLATGRIRVLLHSIAFGNLKLVAPMPTKDSSPGGGDFVEQLAAKLGVGKEMVQSAASELFEGGSTEAAMLLSKASYNSEMLLSDDEMALTVFAMGTSLLTWTRELYESALFAGDARVLGLTSEGNEVAWRGYAAVSAAKVALEAVSRSIAREFAPFGIRSNILQPGVTDTPALRLIPGHERLMANALSKNPFGRLTRVEDVANVVALLASNEASWINGSIIRVDGGERISG